MPSTPVVVAPPTQIKTESVPEGKIVDFLTGRHVQDTPEEYVRQNIERALVRQYGYAAGDCEPEFRIRFGSSNPRVDIAVWAPGEAHLQENAWLLVECKRPGTSAKGKKDGIEQLKSYMAASANATYGLWTNGDDRFCFPLRDVSRQSATRHRLTWRRVGEVQSLEQERRRDEVATGPDGVVRDHAQYLPPQAHVQRLRRATSLGVQLQQPPARKLRLLFHLSHQGFCDATASGGLVDQQFGHFGSVATVGQFR